MRRIIASGDSHVGQVREGNEDALLLRDSVFAVADGMGGHLAGEVASANALKPIDALVGRVFNDAPEALEALRDAVVTANTSVSKMAIDNPDYRGMGTTLTAALVEGRRLHVAHVGDSRAYLLRDGTFSQITDDHTFVQHLIDEGRITREEAAHHPQRSVVTRAIGVSPEVDVDSMSLDLRDGDQVLLCSDGLTGVVPDEDIATVLGDTDDADAAVADLIERANEAGGPDNITVLLLRYEDDGQDDGATITTARQRPIPIRSNSPSDGEDWAGQLGHYGSLTRSGGGAGSAAMGAARGGGDDDSPAPGRILLRATAIVVGLAVLAGILFGMGQFLLSRSYFVGLDGEEVVIYQGIDGAIGPIPLARVVERTDLFLDDIPSYEHPRLEQGRTAADINDARRLVRLIPPRTDLPEDGDAEVEDADDPATTDPDDAEGDEPDDSP
ncbi:MAG: Stp1/IreP family PP2C-type Ser/Thr phosphatase [Nitriliruptoraceae bacterium]|nr:Stp1/IreP family PP2C-type Ser/Thr phosphatase [Nitriliruptoraceae bacterium]